MAYESLNSPAGDMMWPLQSLNHNSNISLSLQSLQEDGLFTLQLVRQKEFLSLRYPEQTQVSHNTECDRNS